MSARGSRPAWWPPATGTGAPRSTKLRRPTGLPPPPPPRSRTGGWARRCSIRRAQLPIRDRGGGGGGKPVGRHSFVDRGAPVPVAGGHQAGLEPLADIGARQMQDHTRVRSKTSCDQGGQRLSVPARDMHRYAPGRVCCRGRSGTHREHRHGRIDPGQRRRRVGAGDRHGSRAFARQSGPGQGADGEDGIDQHPVAQSFQRLRRGRGLFVRAGDQHEHEVRPSRSRHRVGRG